MALSFSYRGHKCHLPRKQPQRVSGTARLSRTAAAPPAAPGRCLTSPLVSRLHPRGASSCPSPRRPWLCRPGLSPRVPVLIVLLLAPLPRSEGRKRPFRGLTETYGFARWVRV